MFPNLTIVIYFDAKKLEFETRLNSVETKKDF